MVSQWRRWIVVAAVLIAGSAVAFWALRPQPVAVDTAAIARGALEVTVSEEGRTRVRDIYTVSAPVAGTLQRSLREVGDEVVAGRTVVAVIRPSAPGLLDARARREAEAIVAAVEAMIESANAQVREAEAQLAYATSEHKRAAELRQTSAVSESRFEETRAAALAAEARLAAARATLVAYRHGLQMAKARLVGPLDERGNGEAGACCLLVQAPVDGRVLAIHHESEQVVAAGTALIELGDPRRIEVVAELLSSDAVRIVPGAPVRIDGWGGPGTLAARVRYVEPAGFTKTSALGIEEQRVRAILDFDGPPDERPGLGHGYQVTAHISVRRIEDAPLVPLGALFRRGDNWSVFVTDSQGRARERVVRIGERTAREAVVLAGLEPGERVVLYPSDRVTDGVRIRERDGR